LRSAIGPMPRAAAPDIVQFTKLYPFQTGQPDTCAWVACPNLNASVRGLPRIASIVSSFATFPQEDPDNGDGLRQIRAQVWWILHQLLRANNVPTIICGHSRAPTTIYNSQPTVRSKASSLQRAAAIGYPQGRRLLQAADSKLSIERPLFHGQGRSSSQTVHQAQLLFERVGPGGKTRIRVVIAAPQGPPRSARLDPLSASFDQQIEPFLRREWAGGSFVKQLL